MNQNFLTIGSALTGKGERTMPDREKVIGHLNDCMKASRRDNTWVFVRKDIVADAITLLKKQEAKQAIKQTYHVMMNRDYENPVEVTRYDWLCPTCKSLLCRDIDVIDDNYHFCKVCGQAVKWE